MADLVSSGAVGLVGAIAVEFPLAVLQKWEVLLAFALIGAALVAAQAALLEALPGLIAHEVETEVAAVVLEEYRAAQSAATVVMVDVIVEIADIVDSGKPGTPPIWPPASFRVPSLSPLMGLLRRMNDGCSDPVYTEPWETGRRLIVTATDAPVCALNRYLYPVPWLYRVVHGATWWLYTGGATPRVGYGTGDNCNAAGGGGPPPPDNICISLGLGWFVLEMVLPAVILVQLAVVTAGPAWRVARGGARLAWDFAVDVT